MPINPKLFATAESALLDRTDQSIPELSRVFEQSNLKLSSWLDVDRWWIELSAIDDEERRDVYA